LYLLFLEGIDPVRVSRARGREGRGGEEEGGTNSFLRFEYAR